MHTADDFVLEAGIRVLLYHVSEVFLQILPYQAEELLFVVVRIELHISKGFLLIEFGLCVDADHFYLAD